jgi:hypothetical protein
MRIPVKDCDCEDFPLCEHADNFPEDSTSLYCDICGFERPVDHRCFDWEDEEDEDGEGYPPGA